MKVIVTFMLINSAFISTHCMNNGKNTSCDAGPVYLGAGSQQPTDLLKDKIIPNYNYFEYPQKLSDEEIQIVREKYQKRTLALAKISQEWVEIKHAGYSFGSSSSLSEDVSSSSTSSLLNSSAQDLLEPIYRLVELEQLDLTKGQ